MNYYWLAEPAPSTDVHVWWVGEKAFPGAARSRISEPMSPNFHNLFQVPPPPHIHNSMDDVPSLPSKSFPLMSVLRPYGGFFPGPI